MGIGDFFKNVGKGIAGGIIRGGSRVFIPVVGGEVGDGVAKAIGLKKGGKVKVKAKAKPKAKAPRKTTVRRAKKSKL